MSSTIRPSNSGYIPTEPLEYWYHFSCKKFVEKLGITNNSDQLPDFTFLIEGGDQLILVDTGMSWTEHTDRYHHGPSMQRPGVDDVESRLAQVGCKPSDVDIVLFTHLYWDHVFCLEKFTEARFICHEIKWNYAHNPIPLHYKFYCKPIIAKDGNVTCGGRFIALYDQTEVEERFGTVKGEAQIAPGASVYESFGHCPGHMTVVVETEDGPYYCVGDSVFVMRNIDAPQTMQDELHYDICLPGHHVDIVAAWQTIHDTVRRCEEAGVDPRKHLLLARDIILPVAVERYEDTHENRLPVIGLKDTDFVFDEYKSAIIERDAKKIAAKAKAKYFSQN